MHQIINNLKQAAWRGEPVTIAGGIFKRAEINEFLGRLSIRNYLISKANEFQNDFLTVEKFGEYHGLTEPQAREFLTLAQAVRASNHPDE